MTQTSSRSASVRSVYDELRRRIVDGDLRPGEQLVEATIAKAYAVSRTPVREALNQLVYEGIVERHQRNLRVRVLDPEQVLELYEVRIALERAAARAAAERRTELDLRALRQVSDQMQALSDDAVELRPKLAHSYHFTMWRASHNPALIDTLEAIQLRVTTLSSTTLHYPQRWTVFRAECDALTTAIGSRDPEEAGRMAELQMTNARDFRLDLYSAQHATMP